MALNTTATVSADIVFQQQDTDPKSTTNFQGSIGYSESLVSGTGVDVKQIDSVYNLQDYIIPSGGTGTFNFKDLQQSIFNTSITIPMTGLKSLVISNKNTGIAEYLLINTTGSNAFTNLFNGGTGNVKVNAGGAFVYADPLWGSAVTASNKYLYVVNAGKEHGNDTANTGIKVSVVAVGITGLG